ncbi:hypothetical protein [Cerasicoccus arenae]|uniref:hypothetical protein n=1 Tax=Cerasicoccus arenae TaxID=424488 RepID=UPI0016739652|nr:hypothetical protein [Cerasicoccus arenae]MBK1857847.1 hypothetical protein [Cerasicoccus arenae]
MEGFMCRVLLTERDVCGAGTRLRYLWVKAYWGLIRPPDSSLDNPIALYLTPASLKAQSRQILRCGLPLRLGALA